MRSTWTVVGMVWLVAAGLALPRVAGADEPPRPAPAPAPTAAPTPPPTPVPAPPPPALMGLEAELSTLVEATAKKTGMLFAWHPQDKQLSQRRVRLTRDLIATGELGLPELRRVLSANDLALVPMGTPGKELYWVMDARQQGAILKLKAQAIDLNESTLASFENQDGLFVTAAIHTKLTSLRDARQALSRIVTQQNIGNVTEVPDASLYIVTDFAPTVCAIYRIIRQMESSTESPGGRATVSLELKHADAATAAVTIGNLFAPQPGTPTQAGPLALPSAPRVQADVRSNRLLVTGTPSELDAVREAVALLDIAVPTPATSLKVIALKHAAAHEVAQTLQFLANGPWREGPGGSARPSVTVDMRTNSLVVAATARVLQEIQALVVTLDVAVAPPSTEK